jgi:hypothetical protein
VKPRPTMCDLAIENAREGFGRFAEHYWDRGQ